MAYGSDMSFPFYTDVNGSPIEGSAWFGVAGQNPVTNPVTVYWDSAGTQPASQPVTISKGRTVRSDGTPCRVWVAGDFSALVQNKLGAQVLFEPNQPVTIAALNAVNQVNSQVASATAQAVIATTQAGIATTQAGLALGYAAAAATNAKFFDTIALGNAGVADGVTFGVKSGGSDGLTRPTVYRRDSAGAQTLLYTILPASEYDAQFGTVTPSGYAWVVADQDGKAALGIMADGTVKAYNLNADNATLGTISVIALTIGGASWQTQNPVNMPVSWVDQDGKMAMGIDGDGIVHAGTMQLNTLNGVPVAQIVTAASATSGFNGAGNYIADIVHIPIYGQSLSTGVNAVPVISTSQRFNNLKFSGGVRAQDAGASPAGYASLQPLVETLITPSEGGGGSAGETCATGMSDYIRELIASEDGILYTAQTYQLLVSCPGIGGVTIATLSKPGACYTRLINDVTYGYSLAQAAGKTYKVPALCWLQGESDAGTATATYLAALEQLRSDFQTDVQAITGQTDSVEMFVYQTAQAGNPQLAQLQAVETYPHIRMAGPHYHLTKVDGTHFTNTSSKVYGAYLGRAVKRVCIDGGSWAAVRPLSWYRQGALAYMKFNLPKGEKYPLVFDSATLAGQPNQGFTLVDSGGTPITISGVAITGPDTVRITAASNIPAGAKLRYAIATQAGNLRDSAGSAEIFGGNGINYAMHNWCAAFEKTL